MAVNGPDNWCVHFEHVEHKLPARIADDAFMHRRNYRKSSGVIVDECREHGTWLDPDELEQIAGFILSGGETSETLADEDRKCTEAAAAAARARTRLSQHMGPGIGSTHRSEIDLVDGLVGVLSKIFS